MRKVEELAAEEGFGLLAKMAIKQKTGFGGLREIRICIPKGNAERRMFAKPK